MSVAALFSQLPASTSLLVISTLFALTSGHALPRETKTVDFHLIDTIAWPSLPTAAPLSPVQLRDLRRRQDLNTICGYIGGDPKLPATCSAGSHCVLDSAHGAIGCCPNGGACTTGVFTGCADKNSGPQTEVNPYVFTCQGSDVCYKNTFDGGFFQYGCGTASTLGTLVATSIKSGSSLPISSISVSLTFTPTGSRSSSSSTSSPTSSSSTTATSSSTQSPATQAPEVSAANGGVDQTGAIIGGTISGVAILIALIAVAIYLIKRRKGNTRRGPGPGGNSQYIRYVALPKIIVLCETTCLTPMS